MKHFFTQEELKPSEKALSFIRHFAYTYRAINMSGSNDIIFAN